MKRSDFLKNIGLGGAGLILPEKLLKPAPVKIYDNYIRGLPHYDFDKLKKNIKQGDVLILMREYDNVHDTFAVQVFVGKHKIGYLPAYENIVIANMLDADVELNAFVSKIDNKDKFRAIAIEVYTNLIKPTKLLITKLESRRSDDMIDIYRRGYDL